MKKILFILFLCLSFAGYSQQKLALDSSLHSGNSWFKLYGVENWVKIGNTPYVNLNSTGNLVLDSAFRNKHIWANIANLPATYPVTGTFWQGTQPVSLASVPTHAVTQSGTWNIGTITTLPAVTISGTVPVSGTFYQATQPISAASLPLPSGAAISLNQLYIQRAIDSLKANITIANTGFTANAGTNLNTSALATNQVLTQTWRAIDSLKANISALPLPSGASTAAKQPALGTFGTPSADVISTQGSAVSASYSVASPANNAVLLASTDVSAYKTVSVQVTSTASSGTTTFQASNDNSTWVSIVGININATTASATNITATTTSTGIFQIPVAFRYFRIINTGTGGSTSAGTIYFLTLPSQSLMTTSFVNANTPFAVTQSGTWTAQIGNTANTTPILATPAAGTAAGASYSNISTNATTTVKSGAGTLYAIVVNGIGTTEVLTIYDNTAGSGTKIGTVTVVAGQPINYGAVGMAFGTGLTIVSSGSVAGDFTVIYK